MILLAGSAVGVSGCGAAGALSSGSPRACSEAAVHDAIRKLVVPSPSQPDHFSGNLQKVIIAANSLLPQVELTYSDMTLDGFDKDTHTATCSASVQVKLEARQADPLRWTYAVQPSSESGGIVVSSDDHSLPHTITSMVTYAAKVKSGTPF